MSEDYRGSSRRRTLNTGTTERTNAGAAGRTSTGAAGRASTGTTGRASTGTTGRTSTGTTGRASTGTTGRANTGSSGRSSAGNTARSSAGGTERNQQRSSAGDRKRSPSHGSATQSSGSSHYRRKKKKPDITQILMYCIGAVILILAIALAVKGCGKIAGKDKESTEATDISSVMESTGALVTVDGFDITGMSQEEAKTAVMKQYDWGMKVTYKDKEAAITNLLEVKVTELLEEIYASDKQGAFSVNTDNLLDAAKAEAALVSGNWNMVGQNGGISGYDAATGKFTFTQGTNGIVIDQDKLAQDIVASIGKKDYKAVLAAQTKEVAPDMSAEQLEAKYKTIASYTTKATNSSNRNENIRLACNALNGVIVNPGQEFSFNEATGARTEAKGYKPATAYLNGEIVQEPGGGVCQISSTLYNAVIFAGLTSTERHAHSYEPSYVTPGEDAAVSFGGPDFRFVNNSDFPIAIKTSFFKQELAISIYGVPILKEGEKVRMSSEKVGTLAPPAPTYEEDQTLQLTEEKIVKQGTSGSSWKTYLVKYQGEQELSREFFHNSSYRGKAPIVKRNTSGVVVTTAAPTEAPSETPSIVETLPVDQGTLLGPGQGAAQQPSQVSPGGPGTETTASSPVSPGGNEGIAAPVENSIPVSPGQQVGPGGPGSN